MLTYPDRVSGRPGGGRLAQAAAPGDPLQVLGDFSEGASAGSI